jgi:hypothetical protein
MRKPWPPTRIEMRFERTAPLDPKRWVTMNALDEQLRAPGIGGEWGGFTPKRIESLDPQTVRVWPIGVKAGQLHLCAITLTRETWHREGPQHPFSPFRMSAFSPFRALAMSSRSADSRRATVTLWLAQPEATAFNPEAPIFVRPLRYRGGVHRTGSGLFGAERPRFPGRGVSLKVSATMLTRNGMYRTTAPSRR